MDQNPKQQYLDLFVKPLNRNGFIYKIDPQDPNVRTWNWTKKDTFFHGGFVDAVIEDKEIYGLSMKSGPHGHYTDRIIIDLDDPVTQYEITLDVMEGLTNQRDPHLLFQSSEREHLHCYYFLDNHITGKNIEYIRQLFLAESKDKGIQRIEVFPAPGNGLRLPLAKGGEWLHSITHKPYSGNKDELISRIYKKVQSDEIQKIDSYHLIGQTLPQKEKESAVFSEFRTFKGVSHSTATPFKQKVKEIELRGIKAGERHECYKTLVLWNIHRGLDTEQSVNAILERSFRTDCTSKDITRARQTGNTEPLEKEIRRMDAWCRKNYDPTKLKKFKFDITPDTEEIAQSYLLTESLGLTDKRKPRQKISEFERVQKAILFIWTLYKARGWKYGKDQHKCIRLPKKTLNRAGIYRNRPKQFDPLKPLFNYGLLKTELNKGSGLSTVYSLHYELS